MWCWLWFLLFLITFLKSSGVALALQIKIWFLMFFKISVTFVGDWVFKQGRIAGKAGKRTTGIAAKPYTFFPHIAPFASCYLIPLSWASLKPHWQSALVLVHIQFSLFFLILSGKTFQVSIKKMVFTLLSFLVLVEPSCLRR